MTPSRRTLLGGLAGATLARGCVPVPALAEGPDAELIRLCADMEAAHKVWFDLCDEGAKFVRWPAELRGRLDAAHDAVYDLVDEIADIAPTTLAGVRAKARAAVTLWSSGNGPEEIEDNNNISILARALVLDFAEAA